MNDTSQPKSWPLMAAVFFVALNLRPALASVAPLSDHIMEATGLHFAGIGSLTTLPVILMGVGALFARSLRNLLGEVVGIGLGTLVVAGSCAARIWEGSAFGLITTAVSAGIGIAIVQALAPSYIKRNFPANPGGAIGLYSCAIILGAALSAAGSTRLAEILGWAGSLAAWTLPAFFAVLFWSTANRTTREAISPYPADSQSGRLTLWKHPRSWSLLVFFGIGTGAFMLVMAWLPAYYVQLGQSAKHGGDLLATMTGIEALTALGVATFIHHVTDRRPPLMVSLVLVFAGLVCLLVAPIMLALPAVIALGIGIGILFPLSIVVTVDHLADASHAGDLAAFVQGGGFVVAGLAPLGAGTLRDVVSSLEPAWSIMALSIVAAMVLALRYSPSSYSGFRAEVNLRTNDVGTGSAQR